MRLIWHLCLCNATRATSPVKLTRYSPRVGRLALPPLPCAASCSLWLDRIEHRTLLTLHR